MASDMALFSMTLINELIKEKGIAARCLGMVHDALNFEVREDHLHRVLPIIKATMEDPIPLRQRFGVHLNIPIIADLKVGSHWGDATELSPAQVWGDEDIPLVRGNAA
jgi:DNA polymerase I-like protein with 3'-5' exonuclease and polymerase domains